MKESGRTKSSIKIRPLVAGDWQRVRSIYLAGIATGQATFETRAPTWKAWDAAHLANSRLAAVAGETLVGWGALAPVSGRAVYAGVAEVSVYIDSDWRGRGIGRMLLKSLISESERHGFWTLQASIFPENVASISLHRRCGFREVGHRERIAKLKGVWRNTVLLERRSQVTGRD
jgi:phosphinothricin acetyltransferase